MATRELPVEQMREWVDLTEAIESTSLQLEELGMKLQAMRERQSELAAAITDRVRSAEEIKPARVNPNPRRVPERCENQFIPGAADPGPYRCVLERGHSDKHFSDNHYWW